MDLQTSIEPGNLLENRYRILRLLGQGGMSRVYLAEDTRLGTRVAVKENLQTTAEARAQFEREARLLASLTHPNLPGVNDYFVDARTGLQYLVMDYVEGEDLDAMIKRAGPLPENTAVEWIVQILSAVEYLHAQNPPIIHRDIKPANIKITPEGKAVLVDFGIAKTYDPQLATRTGARAVTPGYAPPEQYGMRTDQRSDIYALGATLYTMLTGRVPPEAPLRMSAVERVIPPQELGTRISQNVDTAVRRAMEVETTRRWQRVADLRAMLQARTGEGLEPGDDSSATRMIAPRGRAVTSGSSAARPDGRARPLWLWLVAGGILVLLAALLILQSAGVVPPPPGPIVVRETAVVTPAPVVVRETVLVTPIPAAPIEAVETTRVSTPAFTAVPTAVQKELIATTSVPTAAPTPVPTAAPKEPILTISVPTAVPTPVPTAMPTRTPTVVPTPAPTIAPTLSVAVLAGTRIPVSSVISTENANRLTQLALWGQDEFRLVGWSADGKRIAVAGTIGIYNYDVSTFQATRSLDMNAYASRVALSPDGQRLASVSDNNTIKVWDVASGRESLTLSGHTGTVWSVAFSPDGKTLVSGSQDTDDQAMGLGRTRAAHLA